MKRTVEPPDVLRIERGIPVPPRWNNRLQWPFDKMKVGESFAIDGGDDPKRTVLSLRGSAETYAKHHPDFHFTIRRFTELDGKVRVRLWRTSTLAGALIHSRSAGSGQGAARRSLARTKR